MNHLREIRESRNLTMKNLGEMVGLSESAIWNYEVGKRAISYEMSLRLGEALQCGVTDIFEGEKKPAAFEGDGVVHEPYEQWADKDARLLKWFRSLPIEKQRAILFSQDAPEDLV